MTIGSLFSGIGGLELGLESLGLGPVIWQAESDPAARRVLAKHWPTVHRYTDVRQIDATAKSPEIICGGFPCQDISVAGAGAGIGGARSGLWREFARIVRALEPTVVFVENVPALASRGLDQVLQDLAQIGLDAEWTTVRASDVGAPHRRERLFILAYADGERVRQLAERDQRDRRDEGTAERVHAEPGNDRAALADAGRLGGETRAKGQGDQGGGADTERGGWDEPLAYADGGRREGEPLAQPARLGGALGGEPDGRGHVGRLHCFPPGPAGIAAWDGPQPAVCRGDARVPFGMDRGWGTKNRIADRLRLLGNACVPAAAARAWSILSANVRARCASGERAA